MLGEKWFYIFFSIVLSISCMAQGYDFLVREAESKMESEKYAEALNSFEKAFKSGEYHSSDFLNVARIYARLDKNDEAFTYLHKAVKAGFADQAGRHQPEFPPDQV